MDDSAAKLDTLRTYLDAQDKTRPLPLAVIASAVGLSEEETDDLLTQLALEEA